MSTDKSEFENLEEISESFSDGSVKLVELDTKLSINRLSLLLFK